MTRLVVTDQWFGNTRHEELLARQRGVEFAGHQCDSEADTIEAVRGASVVLVNFAPITEAVLAALAPGATVVRYGIGFDNVDTGAAARLGVAVANVPDYGIDTVADHAAAALLCLLRRLPLFDRKIRDEGWCEPGALGGIPSFRSTVIGLIGAGRIAQELAGRLAPFGFTILGHDPYARPESVPGISLRPLADVLGQAHALSLHVPVTGETQQLVDAGFLKRMRPGAVLVNTSRGALVDEEALADALASGHLTAAALDVYDPEPPAADSRLRHLPNVVLTPHAAFYSDDSLEALQRLATEEAGRALAGEPLRCRVA
ncbi:C-terminal binding protein [Nonomuraea insulae]|uniref:C-terminal binding protein n=1 Tax=Nonomuraea insulae TaxID=1616787 RepID=A0ABW1CN81_9ACTN